VNRVAVPALKEADSDFALAVARVAAALEPTLGAPQETVDVPVAGATRLRRFVARHVAEGRT
jgi:hypothetical protein